MASDKKAYIRRLAKYGEHMQKAGLDALLLIKPSNMFCLTGDGRLCAYAQITQNVEVALGEPSTNCDQARIDESARFLVNRLSPRGIKREALTRDGWLRDVAPSESLRRCSGHDPTKWEELRRRYFAELDAKPETWRPIREAAQPGDVTLLYGARDAEHNNAVALRDYLRSAAGAGKTS